MKPPISLYTFFLLLISCSTPKEGEYYERLSDGQRISIESIGKRGELVKHFRYMKAEMEKLNLGTVGTYYHLSSIDSLGKHDDRCVLSVHKEIRHRYGTTSFMHYYSIVTIDEFLKEHRKL
jgi:hypothetical protein